MKKEVQFLINFTTAAGLLLTACTEKSEKITPTATYSLPPIEQRPFSPHHKQKLEESHLATPVVKPTSTPTSK